MKKNILIILIIAISAHLNAMEPQNAPCLFYTLNNDVMNLIASFLTFDDVETEEEFIQRKKSLSSYPTGFYTKTKTNWITTEEVISTEESEENDCKPKLMMIFKEEEIELSEEESLCPEEPTKEKFFKDRSMPFAWLEKHKNITDIDEMHLAVYSANKNICAMTYYIPPNYKADTLSIIDTTTNQEVHNIRLYKTVLREKYFREKYFHNLAISSCGNIFATIYIKWVDEDIGFKSFIKIKNLQTQQKEYPDYPTISGDSTTIAFNKQGTHLIMHKIKHDSNLHKDVLLHAIIPLTTTLNDHPVPQKTLSHYFAQKMVCKKLFTVAS